MNKRIKKVMLGAYIIAVMALSAIGGVKLNMYMTDTKESKRHECLIMNEKLDSYAREEELMMTEMWVTAEAVQKTTKKPISLNVTRNLISSIIYDLTTPVWDKMRSEGCERQ